MLPRDEIGKGRRRRDVAAFANSSGGFVVFGVKDDKGLPAIDRIVGLPATQDFPEHFGNFPSSCEPSVEWTFKNNPPLALNPERVIHVVHIPASSRRPHGVFEDHRWSFCKRTNKGTEAMSHGELRSTFATTREKSAKLQMLVSEIQHIRDRAWEVNIRAYHAKQGGWAGNIPAY